MVLASRTITARLVLLLITATAAVNDAMVGVRTIGMLMSSLCGSVR